MEVIILMIYFILELNNFISRREKIILVNNLKSKHFIFYLKDNLQVDIGKF